MTQHTEFIKRLRYEPTASQYLSLADLIASLHEDRKNAANALEAQAREIAELKAQESELCTLYGLAEAECQKLRAEVEGLRKDAERLNWLESSSESHGFCHTAYGEYRHYAHQIKGYPTVREVIDAAMKGQP